MDLNTQVGETAGKVWHALSSAGPQTLAQLKKKVDGSGELLSFGLGWLAREDNGRDNPGEEELSRPVEVSATSGLPARLIVPKLT
jgi:Winged helix-turn-helix domain (DUF2582)